GVGGERDAALVAAAGVDDFRDVEVAAGVGGDAVGGEEAAGRVRVVAAPAGEDAAVEIEDGDATGQVVTHGAGHEGIEAGALAELGDEDDTIPVDVEVIRANEVGPLDEEAAVGGEHLDARVLA